MPSLPPLPPPPPTRKQRSNLLVALYDQIDAIRIMLQQQLWTEESRRRRTEEIAKLDLAMSHDVDLTRHRVITLERAERDRQKGEAAQLRFWLLVCVVLLGVVLGSAFGAWLFLRGHQ